MAKIEVNELGTMDSSFEIRATPRDINSNYAPSPPRGFVYRRYDNLVATRIMSTQTNLHVVDQVRPVTSDYTYANFDMYTVPKRFATPMTHYYYESVIEYLNNVGSMCVPGPVMCTQRVPVITRDAAVQTVRVNVFEHDVITSDYYDGPSTPYVVPTYSPIRTTSHSLGKYCNYFVANPKQCYVTYSHWSNQYPVTNEIQTEHYVRYDKHVGNSFDSKIQSYQTEALQAYNAYLDIQGTSGKTSTGYQLTSQNNDLINLCDVGAQIAAEQQLARFNDDTPSSSSLSMESTTSSDSVKTLEPRAIKKEFDSDFNSVKYCSFCQKNGESRDSYLSHRVRGKATNSPVECPILRAFVCRFCGATGDNAHTRSHCPKNISRISTTQLLLKTTYKSCGRARE